MDDVFTSPAVDGPESDWVALPELVRRYARDNQAAAAILRHCFKRAAVKDADWWAAYWNPEDEVAYFVNSEARPEDALRIKSSAYRLKTIREVRVDGIDRRPENFLDGRSPWMCVKSALVMPRPAKAEKPLLLPNPLAAALAGSLLLGASGLGLGWLANKFFKYMYPDDNEKPEPHIFPRNLGLAGLLIGAAPGLIWGVTSQRARPDLGFKSWLSPWPFGPEDKGLVKNNSAPGDSVLSKIDSTGLVYSAAPEMAKAADWMPSTTGAMDLSTMPVIAKNNFGQVVWQDENTPLPLRAATLGVLEAASGAKGGSNWLSPMDIARVGLDMGTGYVTGLVAGRVLGALAGMSPSMQRRLQDIGMWSAAIGASVPRLLGKD
ncbi:MAG: hypothetical protein ONA69_01220 [candidate division KSB1 bacterium]|nr:hypothetical protein [candidate division KSB1 bacterium]